MASPGKAWQGAHDPGLPLHPRLFRLLTFRRVGSPDSASKQSGVLVLRHIRFTVPGRPQAKARPRVVRGRAYTPSKTVKYERDVATCALIALHGSGPLTGPVGLKLTVLMPRPSKIPKSHSLHGRKGRIYLAKGGNFPDLSNVIKAIEDGLNGVLFKDDSQVCVIEAHRFYAGESEQTAVEVEAWTIDTTCPKTL